MAKTRGQRVTVVVRSAEETARPESVTLKLTVPADVARILKVEALGRNCTVGDVVAELVRLAPRRFVLQDRGRQDSRPGGAQVQSGPGLSSAAGDSGPVGIVFPSEQSA
jgi:hypothetical protein